MSHISSIIWKIMWHRMLLARCSWVIWCPAHTFRVEL